MGKGNFLTLQEQIENLKSKGLIVENNSFYRNLLFDNNYYNIINGFKCPFLEDGTRPNVFKKGTKFEEIYSLYLFDRKIRNLVLEYSLIVENSFKTKVAHVFAREYGENEYLNCLNYKYSTVKEKMKTITLVNSISIAINRNNKHPIYKHYIDDKKTMIPIWALVSLLDFGTIREAYENLKDNNQFEIAGYYKLNVKMFISFISTLNMFRNVCAHDNRLMQYRITNEKFAISDTKIHSELKISKNDNGNYCCGKKDFFALMIVFKYLLNEQQFKMFFEKVVYEFDELSKNIFSVKMDEIFKLYGMPIEDKNIGQKAWKEISKCNCYEENFI